MIGEADTPAGPAPGPDRALAAPGEPSEPGGDEGTSPGTGPRRRRRAVLLTLGGAAAATLLAVLLLSILVVVRYVPAAQHLRNGRDLAQQAEALLRDDPGHLDRARLDEANSLLVQARSELGDGASPLADGLLARVARHLPVIGRQAEAVSTLRATALAGVQVGLDLVPIVEAVVPAPGPPVALTVRVERAAAANLGAIPQIRADIATLASTAATIPDGGLLAPLAGARDVVRRDVPVIVDNVDPAIGLLSVVPDALGGGPHTYLILLANPGEERPGGGFIGAVGEVTFRDGAVVSRAFASSDFADKKVTTIAAPRPLNDYLFHGHPWDLGDSNWSPDFPTSAQQAADFFRRETGVAAGGVIEVDPVVFGYILDVVGPISVSPYPQVVTAANALTELNFIINEARPGDPGKVYLAPFGSAVLDRILNVGTGNLARVAAALRRGVHEKHVVLYFSDPALEATVNAGNAGGHLTVAQSDSVEVVDANLSGSKGDLVVTRSFALHATVSSTGEVRDDLRLTYVNPVVTDPAVASLVRGPKGVYTDYVRVYVPETAQLDSLQLTTPAGTSTVSAETVTYENGLESIAYLLIIRPGTEQTLTLHYHGPFADVSLSPESYTLAWQKQLSSLTWTADVTVDMPNGTRLSTRAPLDSDRSWTVAG